MTNVTAYYRLPDDVDADIDGFASELERLLRGDMNPGVFKARRVTSGIYEQRRDGTFMMRIRTAAGMLTVDQAAGVARLAREFGNGDVHVTTRQDVQIHDVSLEDTVAVMRGLRDVGLSCRGGGGNTVRNITASPYGGICPAAVFNVAPFSHAVTEFMLRQPGSLNLPRKYKIAFSGSPDDTGYARANDLGFIAAARDGVAGFAVYGGGGLGGHSRTADLLLEWIPTTECIRVAEAVRRLFDRHGNRQNRRRARLRFVFERLGVDEMRRQFEKELAQVTADGIPACTVGAELLDVRPGARPLGRTVPERLDGMPYLRQRQDGLAAVPIHLPVGFISSANLEAVASLTREFSTKQDLRTTQNQDLLLTHVPMDRLGQLRVALEKIDRSLLAGGALTHTVACAGASTCRLGLCLSRELADACAEAIDRASLASGTLDTLDIRISGCPNACGQHVLAQLGLAGAARRHQGRLVPSYQVFLGPPAAASGAQLSETVGMLSAKAVPGFLTGVLQDFEKGRGAEETFADYAARTGSQHFTNLVAAQDNVPDYSDDPSFYRDWGGTEDFSLAGRGAGECGAGVFEVIQEDIGTARKAVAAGFTHSDSQAVFDALLPTARALVITRGVDTPDPDAIFRHFETHFIDTDLVGEASRALVVRGRAHLAGMEDALRDRLAPVRALLDRVELLYGTLGADLQFHPPEDEAAPEPVVEVAVDPPSDAVASEESSVVELDLKGVQCPINFVKAKLKLETMAVGEVLSILLDEGEPVRNVPASFEQEGQNLLEIVDRGDGTWRVVVQKAR